MWGSAGKESAHNVGDLSSIPGLGTSPGEGKGYHASILAWRIAWTVYLKELDTTEQSLNLVNYFLFSGGWARGLRGRVFLPIQAGPLQQ